MKLIEKSSSNIIMHKLDFIRSSKKVWRDGIWDIPAIIRENKLAVKSSLSLKRVKKADVLITDNIKNKRNK